MAETPIESSAEIHRFAAHEFIDHFVESIRDGREQVDDNR